MKQLASISILVTGLLATSTAVRAQDCSKWTNSDYIGTYTMSGSGYLDLSKFLAGIPGLPPLPAGLTPMSWVGVTTFDHAGGGAGWISVNAGGSQLNITIVNKKYAIRPDCSLQVSMSANLNELGGVTVGPFVYLMVPVERGEGPLGLALHMILQGTAPGAPAGPGLDSGVAYRISRQY